VDSDPGEVEGDVLKCLDWITTTANSNLNPGLHGPDVAVAAALIPGRWAARTNVIEVLHAE
jgi:hypothetical protein